MPSSVGTETEYGVRTSASGRIGAALTVMPGMIVRVRLFEEELVPSLTVAVKV